MVRGMLGILIKLIYKNTKPRLGTWFSPSSQPSPIKGEGAKRSRWEAIKKPIQSSFKNYLAVYPPSTGSTAPVIKEASSDAKKRIAWAISSG